MAQAVVSNYLIDTLLNCVYKNTAFTGPATTYAALFITEPLPTASGTEATGNGYARVAITWGAVASHTLKNSANITFPTATGTWGSPSTVSWLAIFDAATGGNMLTYCPLSTAVAIANGITVTITANQLSAAWL